MVTICFDAQTGRPDGRRWSIGMAVWRTVWHPGVGLDELVYHNWDRDFAARDTGLL